jgi:hypothetical protein
MLSLLLDEEFSLKQPARVQFTTTLISSLACGLSGIMVILFIAFAEAKETINTNKTETKIFAIMQFCFMANSLSTKIVKISNKYKQVVGYDTSIPMILRRISIVQPTFEID